MKEIETRIDYSGDMNIVHGGVFIDISDWQWGYCRALRVMDLDSGCGFSGGLLIERLTIITPEIEPTDENLTAIWADEHCKGAFTCCGTDPDEFREASVETRKRWLAENLLGYGRYDPDDFEEVIQTDPDGPVDFESWHAKRVSEDDLNDYIAGLLWEE